jgi:hypothetical protein
MPQTQGDRMKEPPRAQVRAAFLAAAERSAGPLVREAFFAAAESSVAVR